ncbi:MULTISPECIES: hypothetical protein [Veillonella]
MISFSILVATIIMAAK